MSDGSVVGWHILFLNGTPCPGMVQYAQGDNKPTAAVTIEPESQSPRSTTSPTDVPAPSLFAPPKGFGALESQKSSFLNAPTSATSQPTPMNSSSSGFGKSSAPTFGVTGWGFGSQPSASSSGSVNTIGSAGGFAAFAQSKPSSFGALSGTPKILVQPLPHLYLPVLYQVEGSRPLQHLQNPPYFLHRLPTSLVNLQASVLLGQR